jgi:hypothetical protein
LNSPAPFAVPSPLNVVARQWRELYLAVAEELGDALESLDAANAALNGPLPPANPQSRNVVALGWQTQYTNALTQVVTLQAQLAQLQTQYVAAQRLAVRTKSLHVRTWSSPGPSVGPSGYASFFRNLLSTPSAAYGPTQLVLASQAYENVNWYYNGDSTTSGAPGEYRQGLVFSFYTDMTYPPTEADPWYFDVQWIYRDSQYNQNNVGYAVYEDTDPNSAWVFNASTSLEVNGGGIPPPVNDLDGYEGPTALFRTCRIKATGPHVVIGFSVKMIVLPGAPAQYGSPAALSPANEPIWDFRVSAAPPN